MHTALVYCYPLDDRKTFEPFARRWVETYKRFPQETPHEIIIGLCCGEPTDADREIFAGLHCRFVTAASGGVDIGMSQQIARLIDSDFAVYQTSRVYFHRLGALRRLVEAREQFGRGLYGACGTYERCPFSPSEPAIQNKFPNPHMRTVFYGMDTADFRKFPYEIVNRDTSYAFESGRWNIAQWFWDRALPVKMCTWDHFLNNSCWRRRDIPGLFRRNNQNDLLVFDKHSDAYRDADPKQKREMARAAGDTWL